MFKPLALMARQIVQRGNLTLMTADGASHTFGDGSGQRIVARLADKRTERQLALDAQLAVGEAYMDGRLVMVEATIYDLLSLVLENMMDRPLPRWAHGLDLARFMTRRIAQFNPARRAQRNVAHHYDIDGSIYRLFLDSDLQYSCGYFLDRTTDLDEAQLLKKRHLAAKLALREGSKVLDIGSGWGGLGIYLARTTGCHVDGITLSSEQLKLAKDRARKQGLSSAVQFELRDYRHMVGRYDRIVSVGMFEHVGVNHYGTFFRKIRDLLTDDGVALLHFIGRSDRPTMTNPFIAKYIFPGGYIPALSEVMPAIERSGLIATDIEILRLHYAETLRHWRQRFRDHWDEAAHIKDERFCRMWEFYLAGSECAFRYQNLVVFQIQLARRVEALPWVRDYIGDAEHRFAHAEQGMRRAGPAQMAGE